MQWSKAYVQIQLSLFLPKPFMVGISVPILQVKKLSLRRTKSVIKGLITRK